MDYKRLKNHANNILINRTAECSFVEYKTSEKQLDKILKTICAYGNNYYNNDNQYIFIGVEEENNDENKAVPIVPVRGIAEGYLEKCKNTLNSLRSYLYPNVKFEILTNELDGRKYILIIVPRQTGGPFMVAEKAESNKKINLKAGRYVRIEADTRLARVDEEYDLLRKFSEYHYTTICTTDATVDDLNLDFLREYLSKTSSRIISKNLTKKEIAKSLGLLDKNDPNENKVTNYAVLMFTDRPDRYIPYSYIELIIDMFGSKRTMESKRFHGPIWKQYYSALDYINDNYLNELTVREEGQADSRKTANFPFVAVEELVANAIVHNNYENRKAIQIYISETQINIVNYNKPLPPLRIRDLNERTVFNERDTENPEIRDMFKDLGIIESFGTGIGEAKRAMESNGSPELYYKLFGMNDNVTSVVIPVNEEYFELKNYSKPKKYPEISDETQAFNRKIRDSKYSETVRRNIIRLHKEIGSDVFGNSRIAALLGCSEASATAYIKRMEDDLNVIERVEGYGKGKYKFR